MKYSEDTFIYPYSEEEEKEMLHNTELDIAYNKGVDVGIEQNKIEIIRCLKDKLSTQEIAEVAKISVDKVEKILNLKQEKGIIPSYDESLINKLGFYVYCEEKEIEVAYNEGIAMGIEQNKIEMIKNLKDKLSTQEIADVAKLSIDKVKEIIDSDN